MLDISEPVFSVEFSVICFNCNNWDLFCINTESQWKHKKSFSTRNQ